MSFRSSNSTTRFAQSRPTIECARCGELLFLPEYSEYIDDFRVRHLWNCDACGYAFETSVSFAEGSAKAA